MVDPRLRRRLLDQAPIELRRLRGDIFDYEVHGSPAERFILKFNLRSVMAVSGSRPTYSPAAHWHLVEFVPPASYPESVSKDFVRFLSQPIFHPNVYRDGHICIANYVSTESIAQFALRLARMIKFDPAFINPASAANSDAVPWYVANLASFPIDRRPLPSLDGVVLGPRGVTLGPRK